MRFIKYLSDLTALLDRTDLILKSECTLASHIMIVISIFKRSKSDCLFKHSLGLDPASPIVERHLSHRFRLTRDDARVVQIIHTNAGVLGQEAATGSIDFCINGGRNQPFCHGLPLRRARCSHFLSVCFLANSMFKHKKWVGVPCPKGCVSNNRFPFFLSKFYGVDANGVHQIPSREYKIGQDTPDE